MQILFITSVLALVIFKNDCHKTSAQNLGDRSKDILSIVRDAIRRVDARFDDVQRSPFITFRGGVFRRQPKRAPPSVRHLNLFNAQHSNVALVSIPSNRRLLVVSELSQTFPGTITQNGLVSPVIKTAIQNLIPCDPEPPILCDPFMKFRTANGSCNNLFRPKWGMSFTPEARWLDPDYDDGFNSPRTRRKNGGMLPSPRLVSNMVLRMDVNHPLDDMNTMMLMAWGQFVDHDLTSTPTTSTDPSGNDILCCGKTKQLAECFPIEIPSNDPFFNNTCMEFVRSSPVLSDPCNIGKRQQINQLTSFQDASNVYGSDDQQLADLRLPGESGKLRTNPVNLPPAASDSECILTRPTNGAFCLKAGDSRANEVPHLGGLHVAFLRLHNLIATQLKQINPHWNGERIFQEGRKIIGALQQIITYHEYLPIILNSEFRTRFCLKSSCQGYNPNIDPSIRNAFAAAVLRMGHTQIPREQALLDNNFQRIQAFSLDQTFDNPHIVTANQGANVDELMRFVATTNAAKTDRFLAPEIRDRLFIGPDGSFDLAALNMQRGRDHGIPSYNKWREFCGLPRAHFFHTTFFGLIDHSPVAAFKLSQVYSHPDDIDLFAGGISEKRVRGGLLGPTFSCLFALQFQSLKLGDRFFWETNDISVRFTNAQKLALKRVRLSWIICTVFELDRIQENVFKRVEFGNQRRYCGSLQPLNLKKWRENRFSAGTRRIIAHGHASNRLSVGTRGIITHGHALNRLSVGKRGIITHAHASNRLSVGTRGIITHRHPSNIRQQRTFAF